MSCSCRAAPWRIFLRGLAQVHHIPVAAVVVSPTRSVVTNFQSPALRGIVFSTGRQQRGIKTSPSRLNNAASAAAKAVVSQPAHYAAGSRTTDSEEPEVYASAEKEVQDQRPVSVTSDRKSNRMQESEYNAPETSWKSTAATNPQADMDRPRRKPKTKSLRKVKLADSTTTTAQHIGDTPKEAWQSQKASLKEKFPEGWRPRKRLSPDALAGIRALNAQFPDVYTTQALADKFEVSAEAIRRILKSKWQPSVEEEQDRQDRWFRRGQQVWEHKAALGIKPPKKWRNEGIVRDPSYHEWSKKATRREREWEEEEIRRYKAYRTRLRNGSSGKGT